LTTLEYELVDANGGIQKVRVEPATRTTLEYELVDANGSAQVRVQKVRVEPATKSAVAT